MKDFLLVQEKEVNIPAPVSEGVAWAATAAAAPPLPPPCVWLHEMFSCLSRCFASTGLLSDPSYSPICYPSPPSGGTDGNLNCSTCSSVLDLRSERQQKNHASERNCLASMQSLLDLFVSVTQQSVGEVKSSYTRLF